MAKAGPGADEGNRTANRHRTSPNACLDERDTDHVEERIRDNGNDVRALTAEVIAPHHLAPRHL